MMSLMNIMQYVLERNEFDTLAGNLQGESSRGVEGRREVGRDGERWGWDVAVRSEVGGAEGHGLRDRLHAVEHGLWAGVGSWLAVWVLRERVCGFGLAWGGGAFLDRVGWERRCERLGGEMVVGDRVWVNGVAARESVKSGFFRFVAWMPLGVMFEAVFCRGRACWGRVLVRIDGVVGGNNLQRQGEQREGSAVMANGWRWLGWWRPGAGSGGWVDMRRMGSGGSNRRGKSGGCEGGGGLCRGCVRKVGAGELGKDFRYSDTERLSRSDEVLKLKNFKKDATLKLSKSTNQEWYEHVGPEVTRSQDDKVTRWRNEIMLG
ncbi:hypothetical protein Tco_0602209 [Tanacetum coccineum]